MAELLRSLFQMGLLVLCVFAFAQIVSARMRNTTGLDLNEELDENVELEEADGKLAKWLDPLPWDMTAEVEELDEGQTNLEQPSEEEEVEQPSEEEEEEQSSEEEEEEEEEQPSDGEEEEQPAQVTDERWEVKLLTISMVVSPFLEIEIELGTVYFYFPSGISAYEDNDDDIIE